MPMKTFDESCPRCDGQLTVSHDRVICLTDGCGYFFDLVEISDDESDIVGSDDTEDEIEALEWARTL